MLIKTNNQPIYVKMLFKSWLNMSTNCENDNENFYNVSSTTTYILCHNLIISTVIGELSNEPISFFSAIYSHTCQVVAKIVEQKLFSQIFSKFNAFRLVEYSIFFTHPKPPPNTSTCPWCLHWFPCSTMTKVHPRISHCIWWSWRRHGYELVVQCIHVIWRK